MREGGREGEGREGKGGEGEEGEEGEGRGGSEKGGREEGREGREGREEREGREGKGREGKGRGEGGRDGDSEEDNLGLGTLVNYCLHVTSLSDITITSNYHKLLVCRSYYYYKPRYVELLGTLSKKTGVGSYRKSEDTLL